MVDEKRFVIPLRKEFAKAPRYKRAKKAVSTVRQFIAKHLKVNSVKIGQNLNDKLWERGSKKPPLKVEVHSVKEDDYARVELTGFDFEQKVEKAAKKEEVKKAVKLEDKVGQESKEELAQEGKVEEKKESAPITTEDLKNTGKIQKERRVQASRRNLGRNPTKEIKDQKKK